MIFRSHPFVGLHPFVGSVLGFLFGLSAALSLLLAAIEEKHNTFGCGSLGLFFPRLILYLDFLSLVDWTKIPRVVEARLNNIRKKLEACIPAV